MLKVLGFSAVLVVALALGWFFDARGLRESLKAERVQVGACQDANDSATDTIKALKAANKSLADSVKVAKDAAQEAREKSQERAKQDADRLAGAQKLLREAYDHDKVSRTWADEPIPLAVAQRLRQ